MYSKFTKTAVSSLTVGSLFLTSCNQTIGSGQLVQLSDGKQDQVSLPSISHSFAAFDVNKYKVSKTVCDPFDQNSSASHPSAGIKAELYYRGKDDPRWYDVSSYIEKGKNSEQDLFFSEIMVPTRLFDLGFPKESGGVVKNDAKEPLFEYFALRFTGKIKLANNQEEGLYELALLSDDGTILKLEDENGELKTVVDNDGDHPTRMGCGETVVMTKEKAKSFELKYYQGPRHHIALIPLWRKVDETTIKDPLCGKQGNNMYFDFNNGSTPQPAYNQLLSRGWTPLTKDNYKLEIEDDYNPCFQGEVATITNFAKDASSDLAVVFSWNTNIPAAGKLLLHDLDRDIQIETESDNILRTVHSISIPPIFQSGTRYSVRAIAISDTLGRTLSEPIEFVAK